MLNQGSSLSILQIGLVLLSFFLYLYLSDTFSKSGFKDSIKTQLGKYEDHSMVLLLEQKKRTRWRASFHSHSHVS